MNLDISLILVPIQEQEIQIRKTIDSLAEKYHSYPFVPHITIFHLGTTTKLEEVNNFIDNNLGNVHPFEIELESIRYSDVFTKTLFADYKINSPLSTIYSIFQNQYKSRYNYRLAPHLSLIYKNNMKDEDKEKEIGGLTLPQKLTINRLYVVTKENGSIKEEKDILLWNTAHQITFK